MKINVIGGGIAGAVISRLLAEQGHSITLIEKKGKIGGLCRDEFVKGVLTHIHGPHFFHTNNKKVFDWLSKFTPEGWINKKYIVKSNIRGKLYDFPINRNTINDFFDINLTTEKETQKFLDILNKKWNNKSPKNSEESILKKCGRQLYETFFKNYTLKMWDREPKDLDVSICDRIPVRTNINNVFHNDKYQGVPKLGFTAMINNLVKHENISIKLNNKYDEIYFPADLVICTTPIDEFFDYEHGQLPYRSLKFDIYVYPFPYKQSSAQINYPGKETYTRDTESKFITGQESPFTTVVRETPCYDNDNPMYPVINKESMIILNKYKLMAEKVKDKVRFVSRLGSFSYINMDKVIEDCFELVKELNKEEMI